MINQGISEEQFIFVINEFKANVDKVTCYKPVVFESPNYTIQHPSDRSKRSDG